MKSLKKVLALVLVVALAFSLVTIAGASFTDDSNINYKTAVGVMTGIGAINGHTDGSFKPAESVTRAEAAKMVAYAMLGSNIAKTLTTTTSSFKDVPTTHWASPYIEFCVSKGILNGRGDGTFDPTGSVTGFQLAKMLLCAVGYGKASEYVGANWSFNVAIDALSKGVFTGNDNGNFNAPASREQAALYIFNAITNIDKVNYSSLTGVYTGTDATFAESVYGMMTVKGVVTGNASTGTKGTAVAAATVTSGKITALADPSVYTYTTPLSAIGQVVTVYYKNAATVYYIATESKAVSVTTAITSAASYAAAFGTANDSAAVWNFGTNYAADLHSAAALAGAFNGSSAADAGTYALYNGELVSYIAPATYTLDKVMGISTVSGSESITLNGAGPLSNKATNDVVSEYSGIAVGDYVTVTQVGAIYNLVKVTTVQGKISEIGAGKSYIVLDGTKYTAATMANNSTLGYTLPSTASDYANNTYKLFVDAYGKVFASDVVTAASTSSVVLVVGSPYPVAGPYGTTTFAYQCVDNAGKEVIYNTGASTDTDVTATGFYRVTVNALGVADFSAYDASDLARATAVNTVAATDIRNDTNYYYASDVKFIFVTGEGTALKVEKVTGLAAAAGNDITGAVVFFNNTTAANKVISTVVVPGAYTNPAVNGTNLVYIPKATKLSGTNANGNIFTVYIDGVKTTITATNSNASIKDYDDGFATYTVTNGVYTFNGVNSAANLATGVVVAKNGIFNSYINAVNAAGATVVDLATPSTGTPYTSVAGMEASTAVHKFTIDIAKNAAGAIITVYITAID